MGSYELKPIILCDIDGTLSDATHRIHHIRTEGQKKDWNAFHEGAAEDSSLLKGIRLHNQFFHNTWEIFYLTGRPEKYRSITDIWMPLHGVLGFDTNRLMMRPHNDFRVDTEVKGEMVDALIEQGYTPEYAIEDRRSVCEYYRSRGIYTLQVANGNF